MPHFTFEYSRNLADRLDIQGLCDATLAAALETGMFETGGIRVRAIACDHYAIADRMAENAFLHLTVRIGSGRSPPDVRQAGEKVFEAVASYSAALFDTPHFALSMELKEIDPDLNWKRNSIHSRLRTT